MSWRVSGKYKVSDPDAYAYIAAVEQQDTQVLEYDVRIAINDFVVGCKDDGIWNAIKASCILAGARTLNGALVPLVGTAPTNFNFVSGDYDRKTGLVGDGNTKYLNTNRAASSDDKDDCHGAAYISTQSTSFLSTMGAIETTPVFRRSLELDNSTASSIITISEGSSYSQVSGSYGSGLFGASASAPGSYTAYRDGVSSSVSRTSVDMVDGDVFMFALNRNGSADFKSDARIAFYSIGEAIDLAALDTRVSNLMTAIGAAIP